MPVEEPSTASIADIGAAKGTLFDQLVGAGKSTAGGIVRPSAFAVLRLMTSSNLDIGCVDGEVGRLGAFENPSRIDAGLVISGHFLMSAFP